MTAGPARMVSMDKAWSAAHADFLSGLCQAERDALMGRARRIHLARRQQVFAAGDLANTVFVVLDGCIKLYQLSAGGKEIILWFSFPGELFGLAETILDMQREIFAEASAKTELLVLSQSDFQEFLRRHPQAAMNAIGVLSARLRTLGASLVPLAADDVETRLARLLDRFASGSLPTPCPAERRNGEVCIHIDLTNSELASLIGATRQTVNATLSSFRRQGLIRVVEHHIHVLEPGRLGRLLEHMP